MKVRDILLQLEIGELRKMALSGASSSGIQPADFKKVIPHIQLGLTELHKRFCLKTKTLNIQQYDHISNYKLHPRYAQSNSESTEAYKFIEDSPYDKFTRAEEVLKIEGVFDEKGRRYWMNDVSQPESVFTSGHDTVQVPFPDNANQMSVQYRSDHPLLRWEDCGDVEDILNQEIEISSTYLQALLNFIGARFYSGQGTEKSIAEGNIFNGKFENSINQIKLDNLSVVEDNTNTKLDDNGWE